MTTADKRAALADTLATTNPRATIRPVSLDPTLRSDSLDPAPVPANRSGLTPLAANLAIGSTIGTGGMAIVRSARQLSLGREVAVKTLRDAEPTPLAAERMLREAWITGALEHPNIVPIHDLGADAGGWPMMLLKRIDGRPWSELIGDASLDANLQQLLQICHAVSFAHSRGILHRDLKPSNVMIGSFGEVCVLDWGIAVCTVDDGSRRFPLAAECHDVAGTPAYMAPEMLGDSPPTERTDVYLLGAILYEIITGSPPHLSSSMSATLESIARSEPAFPTTAPPELVTICRRALAADPAARFGSAEELRLAIVAYVEHRGSSEIARESLAQLDELEVLLRGAPSDVAARVTTYQLFGVCRFGFQAALRAWPGNAAARAGLDRALMVMSSYELDQGDARAASVLIAELPDPPRELRERLARLERENEDKARRLARLDADRDESQGSRARSVFVVLCGLAWSGMPLFAGVFPAVEVDHATQLAIAVVSLIAIAVFAYVARASMLRTAHNRGVLATVFLGVLLHAVVEAATWALGLDMVTTHLVAVGVWAGACGTAAVFIDRALVFPTLGFVVAIVATVLSPGQRLWAISASCGVLLTTALYIWHQGSRGRRLAGLADLLQPKI